jgi:hypothetical protein
MVYIPFGEYTPDLPDYLNPGLLTAKNVLPSGNSYRQFPGQSIYSDALTAACKGATRARDSSGNSINFAGDASKLYKLVNSTWTDISKVGGYVTAADDVWEFTQFGTKVIATNYDDTIQIYDMASSSSFADLGGTPPKARHIAVVRDFVVTANTNDSDGVLPHRVRWSGLGNEATWTISSSTQADYQDLGGPWGWCQKVVGGEYGVIFQERGIWRMTYVGSPDVFQFDLVESNKGTIAPGSVVKVGNLIGYLGIDDFYIFDGQQSISIGVNKIAETFFSDLDATYLYNIWSAVDPDSQLMYWAYPGVGNTSGRPNKMLIYNYSPNATKRWAYAETEVECLFLSAGVGYTLDSLDSISSSLDSLQFSLDSKVWTGNSNNLSGFNSSHKMVNFTGSALDAVLDTGDFQINEGYRSQVNLMRPVVDGSGTVTVQVGTRNLLSSSISWGSALSVNSIGDVPAKAEARYHRLRTNITGGFNDAQGIEVVDAQKTGAR